MKRRILVLVVVSLTLFVLSAALTSAAPQAPGTPTLRWVTTGELTAELRADGLTDGGVAGNGAISWDIYFRFPPEAGQGSGPGVAIVAGPAFSGMSPCTFATNVSTGQPSEPGGGGIRGVLINGFCTTGVPNNPVTGDNVLVASITLSECLPGPANSPATPFVVDLTSGEDVFGASVTDFADRNNDAYYLSDSDLTDGAPMCAPTAVELTNVQAETAPNTFQYGALLALAAVAAVVAGAGFALRRRSSAVGS